MLCQKRVILLAENALAASPSSFSSLKHRFQFRKGCNGAILTESFLKSKRKSNSGQKRDESASAVAATKAAPLTSELFFSPSSMFRGTISSNDRAIRIYFVCIEFLSVLCVCMFIALFFSLTHSQMSIL